jgi:hypothetical protein
MSTYEQLRGARLKFLDQDPANANDGQVWYNSTTGKDRVQGIGSGAWSSGANLPWSARDSSGFGTQTAGVIFGGPTPSYVNNAVEYNGIGYTSATNVPQAIGGLDSDGPQTAGLTAGGNTPGSSPLNQIISLDYDGTSWTSNSNLNLKRTGHATVGNTAAQTAAIAISGEGTPTSTTTTSEYDGSSWSAGAAVPGWAQGTSGGGTTSAAFVNGCVNDGDGTLDYNGTSWSSGNNSNHQHNYGGAGGLATDGVTFGGSTATPPSPARTAQLERYDGTSWTSDASMVEARSNNHGKSTINGPAILTAAGNPGPPGFTNKSEEYNFGNVTITPAAWSSGGNLNTTRRNLAGTGIQTAALAIGGEVPRTGKTESYDGSSWSEVNDLNTARNTFAGAGSQTAAIVFGGEAPGPSTNTESWDGTSWTEVNDLNTGVRSGGGFGTQTAAVAMGGFDPSPARTDVTETWNGTSWTTSPNSLPAANQLMAGMGTQTAGVSLGGSNPAVPGIGTSTNEWNGTSWTSSGSLNNSFSGAATSGTQTDGLAYAGNYTGSTEAYNGSTWSTRPSMSTGRTSSAGLMQNSTSSAGLSAGGYASTADTNVTEEFTGETTSANPAQSLTTSS